MRFFPDAIVMPENQPALAPRCRRCGATGVALFRPRLSGGPRPYVWFINFMLVVLGGGRSPSLCIECLRYLFGGDDR